MTWDAEGSIYKTKVNVKKNGSQYIYSTKGGKYNSNLIAKSVKDSIYNGETKKFTSKKLSFYVTASGSCVDIKKVKIRSYKKENGKKIYSEYKTVNVN